MYYTTRSEGQTVWWQGQLGETSNLGPWLEMSACLYRFMGSAHVECSVGNGELVTADELLRPNLLVKHLVTSVRLVDVSLEGVVVLLSVEVEEPVDLSLGSYASQLS